MNEFDVSVVVAVYNSDIKRLYRTIYSVVIHKNRQLEIVMADDGAENNHKDELISFFRMYNFSNFTFAFLNNNSGTVKNIINSLKFCHGKYIKLISPGDYLYDSMTLSDWVNFMESSGCVFSSGRYIEYTSNEDDSYFRDDSTQPGRRPHNLKIYLNGQDNKKIIYNYLLLDDVFNGATILVERDAINKYLPLIDGKVKFSEDTIYKIMISEGIYPSFFDRKTVWYSYGDGVSTVKNLRWVNTILKDHYLAGLIICKRLKKLNWFNIRYKSYLYICKYTIVKIVSKYILFPSLLFYRINRNGLSKGNYTDFDISILEEYYDQNFIDN